MQKLYVVFLIASGCATHRHATVDLAWELCEFQPTGELRACLTQSDVEKLRETLLRCEVE